MAAPVEEVDGNANDMLIEMIGVGLLAGKR